MAIVFISVFFMLFIYDSAIKPHILCLAHSSPGISFVFGKECLATGSRFVEGIAMIIGFVLVDIATLYIFFTSIRPTKSASQLFF